MTRYPLLGSHSPLPTSCQSIDPCALHTEREYHLNTLCSFYPTGDMLKTGGFFVLLTSMCLEKSDDKTGRMRREKNPKGEKDEEKKYSSSLCLLLSVMIVIAECATPIPTLHIAVYYLGVEDG